MSDGFLKEQYVEAEGDTVTITNKFDTTELEKQNYEKRKEDQRGVGFKHVCAIPVFEFAIDPLLKKYQFYCEQHDGDSARKVLRQFLALNPQYKTTDDSI